MKLEKETHEKAMAAAKAHDAVTAAEKAEALAGDEAATAAAKAAQAAA